MYVLHKTTDMHYGWYVRELAIQYASEIDHTGISSVTTETEVQWIQVRYTLI